MTHFIEHSQELTLYSIQLEKQNQLLQASDKQQQAKLERLEQLVKQLLEKN
jgi:hypothetical protein